jgi:hypothetical protein
MSIPFLNDSVTCYVDQDLLIFTCPFINLPFLSYKMQVLKALYAQILYVYSLFCVFFASASIRTY